MMAEWQPIESAPKDVPILVKGDGWAAEVQLSNGGGIFGIITEMGKAPIGENHMTHWMPLPPPPGEA